MKKISFHYYVFPIVYLMKNGTLAQKPIYFGSSQYVVFDNYLILYLLLLLFFVKLS